MRTRPFRQVDVFGAQPFAGNPLAVVLDGSGLADDEMQRFARWTQLSETTFLTAPTDPGADYAVRIFTPGGELPFAGHPTLGSCHAWLAAGGRPRAPDEIVQQCGVGLVRIRADGEQLAFAAPPLRRGEVDAALLAQVLAALGIGADEVQAAQWLDNGPHWLSLRLQSAERVLALTPDHAALAATQAKVGVIGPHPAGSECAFEVRAFAAAIGIDEDPVTGSAHCALGCYWAPRLGRRELRCVQASRRGGTVRVVVEAVPGRVHLFGQAVTVLRGELTV